MRKTPRLIMPALCLLMTLSGSSARADFTTAEIIKNSLAKDCVQWEIKGICLRLRCGLFGCKIRPAPWVQHRIPDLVISAYNQPGGLPWTEAALLYSPVARQAANTLIKTLTGFSAGGAGGATDQPGSGERRAVSNNLKFKEVNVTGNPATAAFKKWAGTTFPLACSTEVDPMSPYFSSEVDAAAWRSGLTEQLYPASWAPWMRPIGSFGRGSWGSVYPRQGYVQQESDVLAAAVLAQRAADIATRAKQPHLYRRVPGVPEAQEQTDQWQMIMPRAELTCTSFGQDADYYAGRENNDGPDEGDYAWIYWPLHDCCGGRGRIIKRIAF